MARFATVFASLMLCARAQEPLEFHSCTGQIGGGVSSAHGDDSNGFREPAWLVQAGGGFATSKRFAFLTNFLYQQNGIRADVLQQQKTAPGEGKAKFYTVMFEPTWIAWAKHRANFYVLGGFGWFRRSIKFTNPANSLTNPGSIPAGGSSSNSGAFDAGMGINVRLTRGGARAFVESRYIHGLAVNSNSSLIPVSAGIRW